MSGRTVCLFASSCAAALFHTCRRSVPVAGLMISLMLSGCAGQMAFRDGKQLIAQEKIEDGIAKFKEAISYEPTNAEYRATYLQTRERAESVYLEQAARLAQSGKRLEAEKIYQRVLGISPGNERAIAGLRNLEREQRHEKLLKEAEAAFEKKDIDSVKRKLSTILAEHPDNERALALQRAVTEKTVRPPTETVLSSIYQKPITIEFKDVALKQVFEVISRSSGLNFLFDKDVKTDQKTSIFLRNSTIESVVHFMLLTNQLEQQILDQNTILIYPNTAAKQKDYQEMVVKSFFLTNAEAKTVANTLKSILKTRDIVTDEKLNMLILRDSAEAIKIAEKLVALHDVAEPEVMLEVEILEVKRTRLLELGIQWPNSLSLTPLPLNGISTTASGLSLADLRSQNSTTLAAGISPVTIRAHKEDSDVNLLANPRIRARNHEKAKILIGERVPNITTTTNSTGFVSESINYIDVGLTLNVEPTIFLDDDVAIKVALEVSNVVNQIKTPSGSTAYQIGTRTASTVLRLKNGENQVLAGLINDEDRRSGNKVPGLGELPVLGRLFGSSTDDNLKTEIVLSITPHLIRNIRRPDAAQSEFRTGTDGSFRVRPDNPGSVAAINTTAPPISAPNSTNGAALPIAAPFGAASGNSAGNNAGNPVAANNSIMSTGGAINTPVATSNGAQLQWQGPTEAKVGDNFTLQLTMQSDQPISSTPLTIGFDNKVLQVVGVTEGPFLKQGDAPTNFTSRIAPTGQITITNTRSGDGGATSQASIVSINFQAMAVSDDTQVQLLNSGLAGIGGRTVAARLPLPLTLQIKP